MEEPFLPNEPQLVKYAEAWMNAGRISTDTTVSPLTAKALYAFGMMRHLIESAGWALKHDPPYQSFYIAAYLLSCGAIELLGRCISGDDDEVHGANRRLACGLKEMASLDQNGDNGQIVVGTNHKAYPVSDCIALRNFCAHGGSVGNVGFDVELVDEILKKLATAMTNYWNRLMFPANDELRSRLAHSAVVPLLAGNRALFVGDMYRHIRSGISVGDGLMYRECWQTYK